MPRVRPARRQEEEGGGGNEHAGGVSTGPSGTVETQQQGEGGGWEEAPAERQPKAAVDESDAPLPGGSLHHRGALLVRLLPPEAADVAAPACFALPAEQDYWDPHVDQQNVASYDVSAVLYLSSQMSAVDADAAGDADAAAAAAVDANTADASFTGGDFRFHDGDAYGDSYKEGDVAVAPEAGTLLTFTSGVENPHSAGRVATGARFALAMWFTRDKGQATTLVPPAPLGGTPPPPPLALWATDRAIASAAACGLASNDSLRESLAEAEATGRPLHVGLIAPHAHQEPSAWRDVHRRDVGPERAGVHRRPPEQPPRPERLPPHRRNRRNRRARLPSSRQRCWRRCVIRSARASGQ